MLKFLYLSTTILVLLFSWTCPAGAEDYLLGPGDVLSIGVWGHEDLQFKEIIIRPDGKINFPLIGEIQAQGLSSQQLTNLVSSKLEAYVKDPMVTVNIVKFRTVRVYVLGEVNRPGMYELDKEHNLLDALGAAGGYTRYAAKKNVYVVCKETGSYQQIDLGRMLKKGDLTQNITLREGDVIYLQGTGIDFIHDVLPYITAAYQIKLLRE